MKELKTGDWVCVLQKILMISNLNAKLNLLPRQMSQFQFLTREITQRFISAGGSKSQITATFVFFSVCVRERERVRE